MPINLRSMRRAARVLFTDPKFIGLTFVGGFGMASFFVFISTASFVYTGQFGLSPVQFSLAFALNAIGFFAASQTAATLGDRFGVDNVVRTGTLGFALFAALLLVLVLAGVAGLPVIVACLFMANACLGVVIPTCMVLALDDHGDIAGFASSLGGTLQMLAGGTMMALVQPWFDGTALPMVAAIAICAGIALLLSRITLARVARPA